MSDISMTYTSDYDIELTHKDARKGVALMSYARQMKIGPDEILAVGDSENDRSMLELPIARTVAVGNAMASIKQTAKEVCGTNVDEGVACLLEGLIREREHQKLINFDKQAG